MFFAQSIFFFFAKRAASSAVKTRKSWVSLLRFQRSFVIANFVEGETAVFSFSSSSIQSLEFNSRKICLHLTNLKIWDKRDKVWSSANSLFKWLFCSRVELRHVSYEIWLDSYPFFSFQIWYSRKWIFAIIGQGKHMRVTSFNPLWVSVPANKALKMYYFYIRDINVAIFVL